MIAYLRSDPSKHAVRRRGPLLGRNAIYRIGVPRRGFWREVVNTNSEYYGGTGLGNDGARQREDHARTTGTLNRWSSRCRRSRTMIFKWTAEG